MSTFITTLNYLGLASIVIAIFFLINFVIKNFIFYSAINKRDDISDEIQGSLVTIMIFIFVAIISFNIGDYLVVKDFHEKLKNNKIVLLEVNWTFLNQNEAQDIFKNFVTSEKKFSCQTFPGTITLDNNDQIPIDVIKHCYEKNRYIIISKNYDINGLIGDIKTDKFNFIENE